MATLLLSTALLLAGPASGPPPGRLGGDAALARLLDAGRARFPQVMADPAAHRAQVLVAEVVRGPGRTVTLARSGWRVDAEYFYPASAIKPAIAVAALQELQALRRAPGPKPHRDSPLVIEPLFEGERRLELDRTNPEGAHITLGHEIRKLLVVSHNDAFNRLYAFTGHAAANERMWQAGLASVRLVHRLSEVRTPAENRVTPAVALRVGRNTVRVPRRESRLFPAPLDLPGLRVGRAYVDLAGLVPEPMDFAEKNAISLVDLQRLLVALVRPEIDVGVQLADLSRDDRRFLKSALGMDGPDLGPEFATPEHAEARFRPGVVGVARVFPRDRVRVWSKAGRAYGFHVENAYFEDKETRRSFFLTATCYANANGVLNDGKYEYDTVTRPFLEGVAELVAERLWGPGGVRAR